jgi:hypothetical protein
MHDRMRLSQFETERLGFELFSRSSHLIVDSNRDERAETWDKLVYFGWYGIVALTFPQRIQ